MLHLNIEYVSFCSSPKALVGAYAQVTQRANDLSLSWTPSLMGWLSMNAAVSSRQEHDPDTLSEAGPYFSLMMCPPTSVMPLQGQLTSVMQNMSMLHSCGLWAGCSGLDFAFMVRTFHVAMRSMRLHSGSELYLASANTAFEGIEVGQDRLPALRLTLPI